MSGIGSGVGAYVAVAQGATGVATFGVPADAWAGYQVTLPGCKAGKYTANPHIVQGGPYIRNGSVVDLGSANISTYTDAQIQLTGDLMNTGMALMLMQAFGTTAVDAGLTGATGAAHQIATVGLTPQDGSWVDVEVAAPDTGGNLNYQDLFGCKITKAEWMVERSGIATYAYDVDAALLVLGATGPYATVSEVLDPTPFSPTNASSSFKIQVGGTGALTAIDGLRKATITLTPKLALDRIYVGFSSKLEQITTGLIDVAVSLEMDYTVTANSDVFQLFVQARAALAGGLTAPTTITVVGNQIPGSVAYDTAAWSFPYLWIMSGGEAPVEGLDIVKNTINLKGTLDPAGHLGAYLKLITIDSTPAAF